MQIKTEEMRRRDFFKNLGLGAAAAVVAPAVVKAATEEMASPEPEKITIIDNGNLTLGTTTPDHLLEVYSKAQMEADFLLKQRFDEELFLGDNYKVGVALNGIFK